jgi:hypothetical protein
VDVSDTERRPAGAICVRLYFGRDIRGHGRVGDEDWAAFERDVVAQALRGEGYNVMPATGVYVSPEVGRIVEDSIVLEVISQNAEVALAAAKVIAGEYRNRFDQDSVLMQYHDVRMDFL